MAKDSLYKLDLKDRKILFQLDTNARLSCSQIANKVGLSTEVVSYRIKKLEQEGVIKDYLAVIDFSRLGIIQFKIALTFQHITSKILQEKIEQLKDIKEVKWIVELNGTWDFAVAIETISLQKVDELKNKILSIFENYLDKKAISILVDATAYNRRYLIPENLQKVEMPMNPGEIIKLDELDMKLLHKLTENGRASAVDLATELNTTARIITYKIKELQKKGVILGFRLGLDYPKIGLNFYKTFIYLDNPKQQRIDELIKYCENHPKIIHHVRVLGNWDLEPEFETYSEQELNNILQEMKDQFSDIIKSIDIITISKEHLMSYF